MADPDPPYTYRASLVRLVDADTMWLSAELGFHARLERLEVRLAELDTPEKKTKAGKAAIAYVTDWFAARPLFLVDTQKTEKWGRWLATLYRPDEPSLNASLVADGHAQPWQGRGPHPV